MKYKEGKGYVQTDTAVQKQSWEQSLNSWIWVRNSSIVESTGTQNPSHQENFHSISGSQKENNHIILWIGSP